MYYPSVTMNTVPTAKLSIASSMNQRCDAIQAIRVMNGTCPDGYDLWYRRDKDPDNRRIPPDYQDSLEHVVNWGQDGDESTA
jgi:hypothetical protein